MTEEERLKVLRKQIIERIKDSKPYTIIIHDESKDLNNSKSRWALKFAEIMENKCKRKYLKTGAESTMEDRK